MITGGVGLKVLGKRVKRKEKDVGLVTSYHTKKKKMKAIENPCGREKKIRPVKIERKEKKKQDHNIYGKINLIVYLYEGKSNKNERGQQKQQ